MEQLSVFCMLGWFGVWNFKLHHETKGHSAECVGMREYVRVLYRFRHTRTAAARGILNSNLHIKWIFFLSEISSSQALSSPIEKLVDMWRRAAGVRLNSGICYYVWFVRLIAVHRFCFRIWLTTDDNVRILLLLLLFVFLEVPHSHIGNTCVCVKVCASVFAFRLLSMYWSGYRILCV